MTIWSMKASIPLRIREAPGSDAHAPGGGRRRSRHGRRRAGCPAGEPGCPARRGAMLAAMPQPPARSGLSPRDHDHLVGPHPAPDAAGAGDVVLTGADLTIADGEAVARGGATPRLEVHARARMDEARAVLERLVQAGQPAN